MDGRRCKVSYHNNKMMREFSNKKNHESSAILDKSDIDVNLVPGASSAPNTLLNNLSYNSE